jgi:hypothetical protein
MVFDWPVSWILSLEAWPGGKNAILWKNLDGF